MRHKLAARITGSALLLLAAAEIFCRLVLGLGTPPLYVADPQIEYLMKPGQDVRRFGNRVLVNQWGMRSQPFAQAKASPGELRVLVFGDSVVNGGSQTDHEQLATSLVQARLAQALHRPVTVGNVSAGSWGPGNWLAYVQRYGTFSSDAVALVVNSGDYGDNPTDAPLNPSTHPTQAPLFALQEAVSRYLPRYLPRLQAATEEPLALVATEPSEADIEKGLSDLRAFLETCQRSGARLTILHHPDAQEARSGRYLPGHDRMRQLAEELGILFIDLRAEYVKSDVSHLYRDSIHPNVQGQEVMAIAMQKAVGSLPLLRPVDLQSR